VNRVIGGGSSRLVFERWCGFSSPFAASDALAGWRRVIIGLLRCAPRSVDSVATVLFELSDLYAPEADSQSEIEATPKHLRTSQPSLLKRTNSHNS
jgi:hypothetical protein